MAQGDDAAEELGSHAVTNGSDSVYISVPDSSPMPADMHTIKGLSYTQAFGIYKVISVVCVKLLLAFEGDCKHEGCRACAVSLTTRHAYAELRGCTAAVSV